MHLLTTTAALLTALSAVTALPTSSSPTFPDEEIRVSNFLVRRDGPTINVVDFTLSSPSSDEFSVQCTQQNPEFSSKENILCTPQEPGYRFQFKLLEELVEPNEYKVGVYRFLSAASGRYGEADVPVLCIKGPSGPNDQVCTNRSGVIIGINNTP